MSRSRRWLYPLIIIFYALAVVLACDVMSINNDDEGTSDADEPDNGDETIPVCGDGAVSVTQQGVGYVKNKDAKNTILFNMKVKNSGEGYAHDLQVNVLAFRDWDEDDKRTDHTLPDNSPCSFHMAVLGPGESVDFNCQIEADYTALDAETTQTCRYLTAEGHLNPSGQIDADSPAQKVSQGTSTKYANPNSPDGAYRINLGPSPNGTDFEAVFIWKNFWTNLPENKDQKCQALGTPNADVYAYLLDDFALTLDFYLDEQELKGNTEGGSNFDVAYEKTGWSYDGSIKDGWVRASTQTGGWEFGGTLEFNISINDAWRCFDCIPVQGGCLYNTSWLTDYKISKFSAPISGFTSQLVKGDGTSSDILTPGGTYSMSVKLANGEFEFSVYTLRELDLPNDFPPP